MRRVRMLPVAAATWGAAAAAVLVPGSAVPIAAVAWGTALLLTVLAVRARGGLLGVLAVVAAAVGAVAVSVGAAVPARDAVVAVADGRTVEITATVSGRPDAAASGDVWFDAVAAEVRAGDEVLSTAVPVRVGATGGVTVGLELGARVRVRGTAFAADAGQRAAVIVRSDAVEVIASPAGGWDVLATVRARFAEAARTLPGDGGALVPGLAVGDTSAVRPELEDALRASSLTHLTAVSGANCAIVVGLAFGLAALCGARRGMRVTAGLGALVTFVLLVTPEPSVVRAAAMAAIAMLAVALGRPAVGLAVLSGAVVACLVVDPWLAVSMGFALSAAATAALLTLARPLASGLGRLVPMPLALGISVPLAAQLVCGPLLILLDPSVPVLGVVANLLAAPAAPIATVAGFFACLAAPFPLLQSGLAALAWLPATWIAGVAHAVAAVPGQRVPWPAGIVGAVLLAAVGAGIAVAVGVRARGWRTRLVRAVAVGLVAVVGGGVAGTMILGGVAARWTVPADWRIAMCDVGQGDAVLLRSGGRVMLVDTGPEPARLTACLQRFAIDHVDVLVLTHFDADHSGGVAAVVGRVGTVLHGPPDADGSRALARLAASGARVTAVEAGDVGTLGDARWRVLWPAASVRTPGNAAGVALAVTGDGMPSTLLLADLDAEAQVRLRASAELGAFDVVKVAHHGSADQDPALYERTQPRVALVSVGAGNDYGHPRASILAVLRRVGALIARTDTDGAVVVWRDAGALRIWRGGVGPPD